MVGASLSMADGVTATTNAVGSLDTAVTVDTTSDQALKVALKMSVAAASNSATLTQFYFGIN